MGIPGVSTILTFFPLGPGKSKTVFLIIFARDDPGVDGTDKVDVVPSSLNQSVLSFLGRRFLSSLDLYIGLPSSL